MIVGAASRDMVADDPRGWRLGGAATYCSLEAARLGLRVGCLLGVDEDAAEATELELLRAAGVDLRTARLVRGPVFENLEADGHRRQGWLSRSYKIPVEALPKAWLGAWLGPRTSRRGGLALRGGGLMQYRAMPAGRVMDSIGAGDVFFAALHGRVAPYRGVGHVPDDAPRRGRRVLRRGRRRTDRGADACRSGGAARVPRRRGV